MTSKVKLLFVFCSATLFAAGCLQQAARTPPRITSAERPDPIARNASDSTFEKFSHTVEEHKQFECVTCHQREEKQKRLEFAGHESCVGCHLNQFVTNSVTEENRAMCSICHENVDSADPPMKAFPAKFREGFNMKFEHGAHDNGAGRPAQGCAYCHSPAGRAQTIPSGIDTHNNCYTCHAPDTKIGSCSVCHEIAPYRRTLASQYNFGVIFSHADHTGRQGVSCNECHNVVNGAPQGRQVTSITILQHRTTPGNNCLQCHNGRRAFSGNDLTNPATCSRCHTNMRTLNLPANTYSEDSVVDEPPSAAVPPN